MSARILIVDDIEANRKLLAAKLEAQYHTVLLAENGPQALEIAKSKDHPARRDDAGHGRV
jgi:two-component system cell cycle response regulator